MRIGDREIGPNHPPLVIAELGINASGHVDRMHRMIYDAYLAGAECVKAQCRIPTEELSQHAHRVFAGNNPDESVWDLFQRCAFTEEEERAFKQYAESLGMIYLSTPFSIAAVDRLERLGVQAYKIGSGELTNRELIRYVAGKKKPMIVSTGMGTPEDVCAAVSCLPREYALLHCTSLYPTRHDQVRLGAMDWLEFFTPIVGLSDHSPGIWTCLGAVALGASIVEKHFTSDKSWDGPDIPVSIGPDELRDLVVGCRAVWEARGGKKDVLPEEWETRRWYLASRRSG